MTDDKLAYPVKETRRHPYHVMFKHGFLEQVTKSNVVIGKEVIVLVTDEGKFKIGDGTTHFNDLPWASPDDIVAYLIRNAGVYI